MFTTIAYIRGLDPNIAEQDHQAKACGDWLAAGIKEGLGEDTTREVLVDFDHKLSCACGCSPGYRVNIDLDLGEDSFSFKRKLGLREPNEDDGDGVVSRGPVPAELWFDPEVIIPGSPDRVSTGFADRKLQMGLAPSDIGEQEACMISAGWIS